MGKRIDVDKLQAIVDDASSFDEPQRSWLIARNLVLLIENPKRNIRKEVAEDIAASEAELIKNVRPDLTFEQIATLRVRGPRAPGWEAAVNPESLARKQRRDRAKAKQSKE